jgi:hypothetical protein
VYLGIEPPAWLGAFALLIILGFVVGHLCVGVASLRTDIYPRLVGLTLLTPILVMAMNFSIVAAGLTSPGGRFLVAIGFALAHLAIGVSLSSAEKQTPEVTQRKVGVGQ